MLSASKSMELLSCSLFPVWSTILLSIITFFFLLINYGALKTEKQKNANLSSNFWEASLSLLFHGFWTQTCLLWENYIGAWSRSSILPYKPIFHPCKVLFPGWNHNWILTTWLLRTCSSRIFLFLVDIHLAHIFMLIHITHSQTFLSIVFQHCFFHILDYLLNL